MISSFKSPFPFTESVVNIRGFDAFNISTPSFVFIDDSSTEFRYHISSKKNAQASLYNILKPIIQSDADSFDEEQGRQISTWYSDYNSEAVYAIRNLTEGNVDSFYTSEVIEQLSRIKDPTTKLHRKSILLSFLQSSYYHIRYSALSGLFYLADAGDVSKLEIAKSNETTKSLQTFYEDLIKFIRV